MAYNHHYNSTEVQNDAQMTRNLLDIVSNPSLKDSTSIIITSNIIFLLFELDLKKYLDFINDSNLPLFAEIRHFHSAC